MEEQRTHKPLVVGSTPSPATIFSSTPRIPQDEQGITLKYAVDSFLLNCKVEGKAHTVVRAIATASLLSGTLGFWVYIIMAIVVPIES